MAKTIIALSRLGADGETHLVRIEQPLDVPDIDVSQPIDLSLRADATPRERGEHIHDQLSLHRGVAAAIARIVAEQVGAVHPIYFQASGFAEAYPWEALYHPTQRFLSRDPRWPIARLGRAREPIEERSYSPPVRICAVLGALGVDARPEWMAIREAIAGSPLECSATVFVSTRELFDLVGTERGFAVESVMIPTTERDLVGEIEDREPHLLHFFCHGSSDYGTHLEVANLVAESGESPLYLRASQLKPLGKLAWLISVNACEGAKPFAEGHSLAYSIVNAGAPAVYAMREAVSADDAHAFCGGLFTEALRHLEGALGHAGGCELNWTTIQAPARERILRRHPGRPDREAEDRPEWTLPVLYVHPAPLRIRHLPSRLEEDVDVDRMQSNLDVLRTFRAGLHPDTPDDFEASVDMRISGLEEALAWIAGPGATATELAVEDGEAEGFEA